MKILRRNRKESFSYNNYGRYILYAIGEIVLVVIGILLALQINNANQDEIDKDFELQSIDLLITDLEEKKKEILGDLNSIQIIQKKVIPAIDLFDKTGEIDTTTVEFIIRNMAGDNSFLNENSPIYLGLSSSNFWRKVPDTLTKQIDAFYRIKLTHVQFSFEKANEYSTSCILNFLRPNHLIYFNLTPKEIAARIKKVDKKYITYVKLFIHSSQRLGYRLKDSAETAENLIKNLRAYNDSKRKDPVSS